MTPWWGSSVLTSKTKIQNFRRMLSVECSLCFKQTILKTVYTSIKIIADKCQSQQPAGSHCVFIIDNDERIISDVKIA